MLNMKTTGLMQFPQVSTVQFSTSCTFIVIEYLQFRRVTFIIMITIMSFVKFRNNLLIVWYFLCQHMDAEVIAVNPDGTLDCSKIGADAPPPAFGFNHTLSCCWKCMIKRQRGEGEASPQYCYNLEHLRYPSDRTGALPKRSIRRIHDFLTGCKLFSESDH